MAADDAEGLRSAPDNQPGDAIPARGKRQRAADLFSPHRYRELQLKAFERRGRVVNAPDMTASVDDEAIDPPLYSDAPAAEAARAHAEGLERQPAFAPLSPVSVPEEFDFPFDPDAELIEDEDGPGESGWEEGPGADFDSPSYDADMTDPVDVDAQVVEATPDEPAGKARRSPGRNMPVATTVGLALLAVTVGAAYFHKLAFAALLYVFAVGAVIEWKQALERHGRRIPVVPLVAATLGLGVATYYGKAEGLVVALLVGCAGVVAWRIGDERIENTLADSLAGVLTLLWIPFLASFLFLLEMADDGWQRVIIVVLAVVGNDTGALIAGVLFGRHKLLPRVSPAKTWEGAIGGLFLGTAAASVAAFFFFDGKWYIGAAVGFASAVAAVIGDLAESALKRDIQVKDMSSVLPGHGGILDRIDSLLFAAPVGYVVFAVFLGTLGGGGL